MSQRSRSPSSERPQFPKKGKKMRREKYDEKNMISESNQSKITCYIKPTNQSEKKAPLKPNQKLIESLQIQLKQLQEKEHNLMKKRQTLLQEQTKKSTNFNSILRRSKLVVEFTLGQIYQLKREEKKKIDMKKGYYNPKERVFICGGNSEQIVLKINYLQHLLNELQNKNTFEAQMLKEQLKEEKKKLNKVQEENSLYREKLKLAYDEENCRFSKTWPVLNKKFQVLELVGKGGFSEVYRAYNLDTNLIVALKLSSITNIMPSISSSYMNHLHRQYETHKQLDHKNIAKLLDIVEVDPESICLALEFCDGPELSSYLKAHKKIPEKKAKEIIKQILSALNYLFARKLKIIHYDLKPHNIMFHKGKIKILDFGLCKLIDSQNSRIALTTQGVGTYWYLPPQTFDEKNPTITSKVDIWSTGVIFYELLYGQRPFGHNMSQQNILNNRVILNAFNVEFPEPTNFEVSEGAKDFIRCCLQYNPEQRLNPKQAFEHRYFSDSDMFQ